jgi:hypothetical protein
MPLNPQDCTYAEIGALFEAIGKQMAAHGLCAGAALDNEGRLCIKADLEDLFDDERAEELSEVTHEQLHEMLDIIHEARR